MKGSIKNMVIDNYEINQEDNGKIVIYGATIGGKIICQCLKAEGINPHFFCDRNKKGTYYCGLPVYDPSVLCNKEDEYKVIIAVTRSIDSVCRYMGEIDFSKCYSAKKILSDKHYYDFECKENEKLQIKDFLKKYPIYIDGIHNKHLVLPCLEVFITERCTLKCRDCSHLIPRYLDRGAKDYDIDILIEQIEHILQTVDFVIDLNILGGEPLLHNELYKLLEWGFANQKIGDVTIISNGTIVPQQNIYDVIEKTKTRIRLSNYGKYSSALEDIRKECSKRGISHFVNDELWTDMGKIYNHNYTKPELIEIFKNCPFSFDFLLLNGKLFRCSHVAHLNNLGFIKSIEHDCIDFTDSFNRQDEIYLKRKEVEQYVKIDYLEGCSYCNGIQNSIQGIEPAIQEESKNG